MVGSSTLALAASPDPPQAPTPITIGNGVYTPNPSGLSIDGIEIPADEQGTTVEGTLMSLEPSGRGLVIGSSRLASPAVLTSQPPAPSLMTIGSQVFTPNPTGFSISGTTISAGAPGVVIDGTMVSLQPLSSGGGGLVVGSSTVGLVGPAADTGDTVSSSSAGGVTSTSSGGGANASALGSGLASLKGHRHSIGETRGLMSSLFVGLLTIFGLALT